MIACKSGGHRLPAVVLLALVSALGGGCSSNPERGDQESANTRAAAINTQLGTEYLNRGQYEVALDKLKRALREDDEFAPAHTVLGVLYEQLGENDLARKHYREAVRLKPADGAINNNYGAFLCRQGQASEAEPYFQKALADPFYKTPAVALANAGVCVMDQGELDKAEGYLRKSLEYDPKFADALLPMANLTYRQQQYLKARGFLQRYEAVASPTPQSLMLGYRVEQELNNDNNVKHYGDELIDRFPKSQEAQEVMKDRRQ